MTLLTILNIFPWDDIMTWWEDPIGFIIWLLLCAWIGYENKKDEVLRP